MKRILFIALLAVFAACLHAQNKYPAVINDPDGYTNVRKGQSTSTEIVRKYYDGDVFYYAPTNTNWYKIYTCYGAFEGYMHKSRIKPLKKTTVEKNKIVGGTWVDYPCEYFYEYGYGGGPECSLI